VIKKCDYLCANFQVLYKKQESHLINCHVQENVVKSLLCVAMLNSTYYGSCIDG